MQEWWDFVAAISRNGYNSVLIFAEAFCMDNTTRLQYLEAMGIESWYPKQVTEIQDAGEQPVSADIEAAVIEPVSPLQETGKQTAGILEMPANAESQPVPSAPPQEAGSQAVEALQMAAAVGGSSSFEQTPLPPVQEERTDNWDVLEREVSQCQKCALCQTRTQTVFGTGNKNADWLFIGEAPGENEDLQGKPFVGNAGLLLTEMIRALGLEREEVFIANILKCRPPNNRDPKVDEIAACHDYLMRQKALISPKIMVAVGRIAAQQLLKTNQTLGKLRGAVHTIDNTPLIVVYHPAYLLRTLSQKRAAWQDLQLALKTYRQL